MKKIVCILILMTGLFFSCSKEKPITPSNTHTNGEITEPSMLIINPVNPNAGDSNITDPEKEDNEKANKKAKN